MIPTYHSLIQKYFTNQPLTGTESASAAISSEDQTFFPKKEIIEGVLEHTGGNINFNEHHVRIDSNISEGTQNSHTIKSALKNSTYKFEHTPAAHRYSQIVHHPSPAIIKKESPVPNADQDGECRKTDASEPTPFDEATRNTDDIIRRVDDRITELSSILDKKKAFYPLRRSEKKWPANLNLAGEESSDDKS